MLHREILFGKQNTNKKKEERIKKGRKKRKIKSSTNSKPRKLISGHHSKYLNFSVTNQSPQTEMIGPRLFLFQWAQNEPGREWCKNSEKPSYASVLFPKPFLKTIPMAPIVATQREAKAGTTLCVPFTNTSGAPIFISLEQRRAPEGVITITCDTGVWGAMFISNTNI